MDVLLFFLEYLVLGGKGDDGPETGILVFKDARCCCCCWLCCCCSNRRVAVSLEAFLSPLPVPIALPVLSLSLISRTFMPSRKACDVLRMATSRDAGIHCDVDRKDVMVLLSLLSWRADFVFAASSGSVVVVATTCCQKRPPCSMTVDTIVWEICIFSARRAQT